MDAVLRIVAMLWILTALARRCRRWCSACPQEQGRWSADACASMGGQLAPLLAVLVWGTPALAGELVALTSILLAARREVHARRLLRHYTVLGRLATARWLHRIFLDLVITHGHIAYHLGPFLIRLDERLVQRIEPGAASAARGDTHDDGSVA